MEWGGCSFGVLSLYSITQDDVRLVDWLRAHNVLLKELQCPQCANICKYNASREQFSCRKQFTTIQGKSICNHYQSIRLNTWFGKSRSSMAQVCRQCVLWVTPRPPGITIIVEELNIYQPTAIDRCSFCREVWMCLCERNREKIGRPGVVVEIDEAKFGKRKYHRGRLIEGRRVFGGYERGTKKMFVVAVSDRTQETLLSVIKEWILPGTTVISDCWKAYNRLQTEGYNHLTVNHSVNFVDGVTGAHTQNIERSWHEVRASVPKYGRSSEHYYSYLCEFLWKHSLPHHCDRIHSFFEDLVAIVYNPLEVVPAEEVDDEDTSAVEDEDE